MTTINTYKALIIDDEEMSRLNLAQLIRMEFPNTQLSMASSAKEAQLLINGDGSRFDILFLDIQMPHQSGLEFLSYLRENQIPARVIFVTAYDEPQYIRTAIRLNAIDYLVKPVKISDLRQAIRNFEENESKNNVPEAGEVYAFNRRIRLPVLEGFRFVPSNHIVCFMADGRRVSAVYADHTTESIYSSLQALEEVLGGNFVRIGRKYIVNPNLINLINSKTNTIQLQLNNSETLNLKVSPEALKKLLR